MVMAMETSETPTEAVTTPTHHAFRIAAALSKAVRGVRESERMHHLGAVAAMLEEARDVSSRAASPTRLARMIGGRLPPGVSR